MGNFQNRNKNNYIGIIIVLIIAIFLLFIFLLMLSNLSKKESEKRELSYDNLTTVKDVIEYYKSTYISEETSKEKGFRIDINLKLAKLPYDEDDVSNEEYYNNLINDIAKVISYKNFKMIDKENDITIKVTCKNRNVASIVINDREDYFIYMDSQISMKSYSEIKAIDFEVTSEILQRVIDSGWENSNYFGERNSIYNDYYIYVNQGIKVRTIQNKIYNIVFDKNYSGNIINNLFPGIGFDEVKGELGKPSFENEEVIGYKGKNIYVFFSNGEISVYRVSNEETDDFFDLADKFIKNDIDLLEFMNELTYMWPDYSKYEYKSDTVYLSYPLKGIEIKINYDDTDGILVYNNIRSSLSKVGRYLENTNFVARLQADCVFEAEFKRVKEINQEFENAKQYLENMDEQTKEKIGESINYSCYPELDENGSIYCMKFISQLNSYPNREINDNIDDYLWISNNHFIYSKKGKGIYSYNLEDGRVTRLVEGRKDYELKKYENGILYYDNNELEIN